VGADTTVIAWELVAILVTLLGGFGGLAFQIGRRSSELEKLTVEVAAVKAEQKAHGDQCHEDKKALDKRLSDGASKMSALDERTKAMQEDIREIKDAVKR